MSIRKQWRALAAGLIVFGPLALPAVMANQLPGEMVSGRINAVSGNSSINIDGKIYRIKPGSPAATAARTVTAGQVVDAQLNGPANSSATEVINLVARGSR